MRLLMGKPSTGKWARRCMLCHEVKPGDAFTTDDVYGENVCHDCIVSLHNGKWQQNWLGVKAFAVFTAGIAISFLLLVIGVPPFVALLPALAAPIAVIWYYIVVS